MTASVAGSAIKAVQDTVQGIDIVKAYSLYGRMTERIKGGNAKITANVLGVILIAAR